jgi:hypothetical protein
MFSATDIAIINLQAIGWVWQAGAAARPELRSWKLIFDFEGSSTLPSTFAPLLTRP